jgi:hypothetical protein
MQHQYVNGNFPTLERQAFTQLHKRFPLLRRRKGFSRTVRTACIGEAIPKVPIIPDGWFVEGDHLRGAATFTCIEIEDKHPLSPEKLWRYCDLADTLDFCGHDLRLFVFDRYGHNERELDLIALYVSGLVEMYGTAGKTI